MRWIIYVSLTCHATLYHAMLCCSSLWRCLLNKFYCSTSLFSVWCAFISIIDWIRPAPLSLLVPGILSSSLTLSSLFPISFSFLLSSLSLNHSCIPNVQQTHVPSTGCEVLHASRKIEIGKCHPLATYLFLSPFLSWMHKWTGLWVSFELK